MDENQITPIAGGPLTSAKDFDLAGSKAAGGNPATTPLSGKKIAMSLQDWPEDYGHAVTRPVNWDEGVILRDVVAELSRREDRRKYTVVWEGRKETVAYRNGEII